jgi:3-hydroxy-9,10-secoandrosta-1,3,5(10)-triene-9,17-dione monooxygenase
VVPAPVPAPSGTTHNSLPKDLMRSCLALQEHEDRPSHEELVARARALQPLLGDHVADGELLRRLPDMVNDALTEAGMFRLLTPTRFGGYGAELSTVIAVSEALGEVDGSSSWLVSIASVGAWTMGQFCSPRSQKEIFGPGPDVRVAGASTPGSARRVDGGLRISGRWSYASGAHHADWAAVVAVVTDGPEDPVDAVFCFLPAKQVRLEKTWFTVGMRGTGSDTWVADDVFVPDHRVIPMSTITDEAPGLADEESVFRLPFSTVVTLLLVGPLLGLGRAALKIAIDKAPSKAMQDTFFNRQSESVGVQIQIAEAALGLRTAQLHAYDIAATLDAAATEGHAVTYPSRAEIRARVGYVAQQVLEAISVLVNVHGAGSFAESNRMQQYWRDANTAARHASLQPVVGYEVYGKSLLGVEERISPAV